MLGTLLAFAALAAGPPPAPADSPPVEFAIRLTVDARPAPRPALRYLLLPDLKELNPGNPIPAYLECFFDQDFSADREVLNRDALRQADRAARLDKPDWQILHRLKTDGIGLLLPDLQKHRSLAAGLQERFRDEVRLGRLDDALKTARTMFAMSRHVGEHPTLIGDLVAIAIAFVTLGPLEEMLEQPGCPNLYWALTNLPSPFIPLDKGLEGERLLISSEFRDLDDREPMTPEQIEKVIVHLERLRDFEPSKGEKTVRQWVDAHRKDAAGVRAARGRLVEVGLGESRVARFPAEQVLLLDERREYEVVRDEEMKLMHLPFWEGEPLTDRRPRSERSALLFGILVPSLRKVHQAQVRLEQRLAMLRHVEALRMYAADHEGHLPASLSEVRVPLPRDPFNGKPFRYSLEGGTAHLRGSPPPGGEKIPAFNLHYEITIRKGKKG